MANKDVFISYKAEEIDEANWVKSVLESNGVSCWMAPACIPGGSSYAVEIPQAIKQAKVFVLILSSKAQTSQWVSREVDLAINEGKVILPFMLENCALRDDFNFYLTNVQRYAAYENKAAAAQKMLNEIKAVIGSSVEPAAQPQPETVARPLTATQPAVVRQKTNKKCVWSLVYGITSVAAFLGVFLIPNVIAIVLSIMGLDSIKKNPSQGKGFAVAGLILGMISMVLGLSLIFNFVGFVIAAVIDTVSLLLFIKKYKTLE